MHNLNFSFSFLIKKCNSEIPIFLVIVFAQSIPVDFCSSNLFLSPHVFCFLLLKIMLLGFLFFRSWRHTPAKPDLQSSALQLFTKSVMAFAVSDELLGTFVPVAVYWIYSGMYMLLGGLENYRLHPKSEEDVKNIISKGTVVQGVLVQQTFQIAVSLLLFTVCESSISFFAFRS